MVTMGILDRYQDWKEIDKGKNNRAYIPEQPPINGHVINSLKNLRTKKQFYQKTYFKFLIIIVFIIIFLYYLLHS